MLMGARRSQHRRDPLRVDHIKTGWNGRCLNEHCKTLKRAKRRKKNHSLKRLSHCFNTSRNPSYRTGFFVPAHSCQVSSEQAGALRSFWERFGKKLCSHRAVGRTVPAGSSISGCEDTRRRQEARLLPVRFATGGLGSFGLLLQSLL